MSLHRFRPAHYHTTFGDHAPAARVASGDSVHTTTLDALGVDAEGRSVAPSGNPLTGPIYVVGALPGDTLAVALDALRPSRDYGVSNSRIAPGLLAPDTAAAGLPKAESVRWSIQKERGQATLIEPKGRLALMTFPLVPFLGCLGVAPSGGQRISSQTAGSHGGNMDYRALCVGATVYFPVAAEGALLFLGDGHAAQGDGEITGSGIEVPFEVELTVRVLKARGCGTPRMEDARYLAAIGNARPLEQACQTATTEMVRWLAEDYDLDFVEASILMGHYVEYDIGNVFDPAYTVACKVPKAALAGLK